MDGVELPWSPIVLFPGDIVLVDLDGVLVDFMRKTRSVLARYPDIPPLSNDRLKRMFFTETYSSAHREAIHQLWRQPGFFSSMHPIPGAIPFVHTLVKFGLHVRFCTTPLENSEESAKEKIQWIAHFFSWKWANDWLITTRDKTVIHGKILIDDNPEICGIVKRPSWQHVLFDREWNQLRNHPHLINTPRIHSWENEGWRKALTLSTP